MLVYAEGVGEVSEDRIKRVTALALIGREAAGDRRQFIPAQCLIELHDVLVRKKSLSRPQAATRITIWSSDFELIDTDAAVLTTALDLSAGHHLRIFDAIVLAAAASVGCDRLYTEDLQNGFVWRGVEIVNPFRD